MRAGGHALLLPPLDSLLDARTEREREGSEFRTWQVIEGASNM
jgi:hypothetical protein